MVWWKTVGRGPGMFLLLFIRIVLKRGRRLEKLSPCCRVKGVLPATIFSPHFCVPSASRALNVLVEWE